MDFAVKSMHEYGTPTLRTFAQASLQSTISDDWEASLPNRLAFVEKPQVTQTSFRFMHAKYDVFDTTKYEPNGISAHESP